MNLNYAGLKQYHREVRDDHCASLRLRIHRALSWLQKAEQCEDYDSQFIFLWIAFNSAYAQETGLNQISESHTFGVFINRVVDLDSDQLLQTLLWEEFTQAVRVLLDNKYVFQPFWNHHNGIKGYEDWQESFNKSKKAAHISVLEKNTAKTLHIIFSRLYTLRNQIMHGGSTWNSQTNRQQLKDATRILAKVVPIIISTMMSRSDEKWADVCYPVID